MKKILLSGLLGLLSLATASAADTVQLNGAGSTFINPIMTKWSSDYNKVDPTVQVNYQSIGSGGGQNGIIQGTVDFGASDGPMSDANLAKAPGKIFHLPAIAGAVVITYNLDGNPKLKFDGATIANIYLGKVTKWNDPAIAALNPGVTLPDEDIMVAHRTDGSGTTYIFTDYLAAVSPDWKTTVGKASTTVKWPTGLGGKGSDGVTGVVKQNPGAIGYVELIYALQNKLPVADVENANGKFVTPSLDSVTAALATATIPDDFRFSYVNAPGDGSYPISGVTWLLVYQQQKDAVKGAKLVSFLKYVFTDGQKLAAGLNYASLPDNVLQRVLKRVDEIQVPAPAATP